MRKEIKIALVAIAALAVLYIGLNFLKGKNLFTTATRYDIVFGDISGLAESSPVYADGYKVGVVRTIRFNYDDPGKIIAICDIDHQLRIPAGSKAEIVADLLGNVRLNLLLADIAAGVIPPGGTIEGVKSSGALGQAADMLPAVQKMLPKLDSILCSLNQLLADPALAASLHNLQTITADLTTTTAQANSLLATLNTSMPAITANASATLENAQQFAEQLNALDLATTVQQANATLENVNAFTAQLADRQGTLGLLLHDPTLYRSLNTTVSSADSLLLDIRKHPKRYMHVSIFGRKDK